MHAFPGPGMNLHVHRKSRCPPPFLTPPLFSLHEALPSSERLLLFCRSSRRDKLRGASCAGRMVLMIRITCFNCQLFGVSSLAEIPKRFLIATKCVAK